MLHLCSLCLHRLLRCRTLDHAKIKMADSSRGSPLDEKRLPSPAKLPPPTPPPPTLPPWQRIYIRSAVADAFSQLKIQTACAPGQPLSAVATTVLHRQPEPFEIASLQNELKRLKPEAEQFDTDALADAFAAWQQRQPDMVQPRRQDRAFLLVHGVSRGAYLHTMGKFVRLFAYANAAVAPLSFAVLLVSLAEHQAFPFPETTGSAACAALLLVCSLLGLVGAAKLMPHVRADADGKGWRAAPARSTFGRRASARPSSPCWPLPNWPCPQTYITSVRWRPQHPSATGAVHRPRHRQQRRERPDAVLHTAAIFCAASAALSYCLGLTVLVACGVRRGSSPRTRSRRACCTTSRGSPSSSRRARLPRQPRHPRAHHA